MDVRVDIRYNQSIQVHPFLFTLTNSAETMTRHESTGNMQQKTLNTFEPQKADWEKKFKIRAKEILQSYFC